MIYLDHHAAGPVSPGATAAMDRARSDGWANPSSIHAAGQRARAVLEGAREAVGAALGAKAADVVLTSGGTEAVNLGVFGLVKGMTRIVTTDIEHPAVLESVRRLEAGGMTVTKLHFAGGLAPDPSALSALVDDRTLVAIQWINHETGTVLPVAKYVAAAVARGARVVVDATQAFGKVPVDVTALGAHAVAVASTKIGGPAGAGALWVRRGVDIDPLFAGGAQERGRRPGSPDAVTQAGFGAAAAEVPSRLASMPAIARLRDRLEATLVALGGEVNGAEGPRAATVVNASFRGWRGEALVAALDLEGIAAASGAACSSGLSAPSPVLRALYPNAPWRAESALRLSLGPTTSEDDVARSVAILTRVIPRAKLDAR